MMNSIKALFVDFNDTISPGNFAESFAPFEAETGWTGEALGKAYIEAGLLHQLMSGAVNEHEFWIGVSAVTGVSLEILLQYAAVIRDTKTLDIELMELLVTCQRHCGISLALLTDNVEEMFAFWRRKFDLEQYFGEHIINSAECKLLKRDPQIYHYALKTIGVRADEALFIDDNVDYLKVAQSVGFQTIHFQGREHLRRELIERGLLPNEV